MTSQRASLKTFRANEHVRLPGEEDPQQPAKRRLIDKHFRMTPGGRACVQSTGGSAVLRGRTPARPGSDRGGTQHALREVRYGPGRLTVTVTMSRRHASAKLPVLTSHSPRRTSRPVPYSQCSARARAFLRQPLQTGVLSVLVTTTTRRWSGTPLRPTDIVLRLPGATHHFYQAY